MLLGARGPSIADAGTHLALHQHGHVHEHIVQLPDAGLQLDDLTVPSLDLTQRLLRDAGVHDDLGEREPVIFRFSIYVYVFV